MPAPLQVHISRAGDTPTRRVLGMADRRQPGRSRDQVAALAGVWSSPPAGYPCRMSAAMLSDTGMADSRTDSRARMRVTARWSPPSCDPGASRSWSALRRAPAPWTRTSGGSREAARPPASRACGSGPRGRSGCASASPPSSPEITCGFPSTARYAGEHPGRFRRERRHARAGLGVFELDLARIEVHVPPAERQDLVPPQPRGAAAAGSPPPRAPTFRSRSPPPPPPAPAPAGGELDPDGEFG